jgi:hypothetical protein
MASADWNAAGEAGDAAAAFFGLRTTGRNRSASAELLEQKGAGL